MRGHRQSGLPDGGRAFYDSAPNHRAEVGGQPPAGGGTRLLTDAHY
jgi:hypothetical protein